MLYSLKPDIFFKSCFQLNKNDIRSAVTAISLAQLEDFCKRLWPPKQSHFITASNPKSASFRWLKNALSLFLVIKLVLVKLGQCRLALALRFFFISERNLIKEKAQAVDWKNLSDDVHLPRYTSLDLDKVVNMYSNLCWNHCLSKRDGSDWKTIGESVWCACKDVSKQCEG